MIETFVYLTPKELLVLRLGLVALDPARKMAVDSALDAKLAKAQRYLEEKATGTAHD